ncbi:MAG: RDD family protein [Kiritimatiellae bacterium]|nr:RDD family protein [Kiritimatiellia bacterium]
MRYWFYLRENNQIGPVPENELLALFQSGQLTPTTMVWTQELKEWARATDIENLVPKELTPPPPPIPPARPSTFHTPQTATNQIRPWIRYWARILDTYSAALVLGFVIGIVYPPAAEWNELLFGMALLFAYCFIEPIWFAILGTTPGKALLAIDVRTESGERLAFTNALTRNLNIWFYGWGMGFPLVPLFTLLRAYNNLTQKKITTWDRQG